jgi:hypothetical protein
MNSNLLLIGIDKFSKNYNELSEDEKKIMHSYCVVALISHEEKESKTTFTDIPVAEFMKSNDKKDILIILNTSVGKIDNSDIVSYYLRTKLNSDDMDHSKRIRFWLWIASLTVSVIGLSFDIYKFSKEKPK